jgi:hypothetical protein
MTNRVRNLSNSMGITDGHVFIYYDGNNQFISWGVKSDDIDHQNLI